MGHRRIFEEFKDKHKGMPVIMGSTALIKYEDYYVFSLNKSKYWKRGRQLEIGYSGIGGKVEEGEMPKDAVIREVKEEIGQELSIRESEHTEYIREDGTSTKIKIDSNPAFVAEFVSLGVPGNSQADGKWGLLLFVYIGTINGEPIPKDIPGILMIKDTNFDLIHKKKISYRVLKERYNIIKAKEFVPESSKFVPTFSGKVLSDLKINPLELFTK